MDRNTIRPAEIAHQPDAFVEIDIASPPLIAGAPITIPGTAGIVEARKAQMAATVQWLWNEAMAVREQKIRRQSTGDLGKRLQSARLV
jgi:hypothetical protein